MADTVSKGQHPFEVWNKQLEQIMSMYQTSPAPTRTGDAGRERPVDGFVGTNVADEILPVNYYRLIQLKQQRRFNKYGYRQSRICSCMDGI